MDPMSIARYGMQAAEQRFAASAQRVAGADPSVDLAQEIVEQLQARNAFVANANVVRVADEMWEALLDIQKR